MSSKVDSFEKKMSIPKAVFFCQDLVWTNKSNQVLPRWLSTLTLKVIHFPESSSHTP